MLNEWAEKWGIPKAAIDDLAAQFITPPQDFKEIGDGSESRIQSFIKLEGSEHGVLLTRNNVGAGMVRNPRTDREDFLRWGLFNETEAVNRKFKSPDLVGIRRVLIQPHHVGTVIGQFVGRECKRADWKWSGSPHEKAQLACAMLINKAGGDAKIVNGPGSFK